MPEIISLKPAKRGGLLVVRLDDGSFLRLSKDLAYENGLCEGMVLTVGQVEAFRAEGVPAAEAGAQLLSRRPFSKKELESRLTERGYSPEASEEAADRLEQLGMLDDYAYADSWIEICLAKNMSGRAIKEELFKRKLPRELIDEKIEALPEPDAAIDALIEARMKKESGSGPLSREKRGKLYSYLMNRGFDSADIRAAITRYEAERDGSGDYFEE